MVDHEAIAPPSRCHVTLTVDGRTSPDTADRKLLGFQARREEHTGTRLHPTEWGGRWEWPLRS